MEKSLSNSPVKSEREVLLVGEFWLGGDARDLSWGDLALLLPTSDSFDCPTESWSFAGVRLCPCDTLAACRGTGLLFPAGFRLVPMTFVLFLSPGIISTFLHVHPFGASIEYICSYLQRLDSKVGVGQGVGQLGLDSEAWAPLPAEIWKRMRDG